MSLVAGKLNVQPHNVDSALNDHKGMINEAAYHIVKMWFSDQTDKNQAFETVCKALESIGKSQIIADVLLNPVEPSPGCSTDN